MGQKHVTLIFTVIFSSVFSFAQGSAAVANAKKEVAAESAPAQASISSVPAASGDVVIVTQQAAAPTVAQQPVIEQPTTVVTASPLTASRADELRKTRERMEIETEQKIVEKLESSRLEDEQKRLDNLFGKKLEKEQAAPAVVVPVAPVVVAPPQKSEEQLKSEITSQVRADLEAAKAQADASAIKPRWSVGGVLSTVDYPDAYNVGSDFGAGIALNWIGTEHVGIELSALFSQATVDQTYSLYKQVDQQNWIVATKYYFMDQRQFSPVVGGLMSFTHREYTDMYQWGQYSSAKGINSATTDSLDVGLLIGVQFQPSKNIAFGLDYRWLTNVDTRYSDPKAFNRSVYQQYNNGGDYRPLEDIDYQFINMSMNFMF